MSALLIVAVADATVMLTRSVRHLNARRSYYPDPTIEAFAAGLGSEHKALWAQRMCAKPEDRTQQSDNFKVHTLMDDWIDVQIGRAHV